jgi:hypothetical protein
VPAEKHVVSQQVPSQGVVAERGPLLGLCRRLVRTPRGERRGFWDWHQQRLWWPCVLVRSLFLGHGARTSAACCLSSFRIHNYH